MGEAVDIVGYEVVVEDDKQLAEEGNSGEMNKNAREETGTSGVDNDNDKDDVFREIRGRADPNMVMKRPRGFLVARTPKQTFVKADAELQSGMCGGAVLDMNLEFCGCVEGVVPPVPPGVVVPEDRRLLQGAACMVESTDLIEFLRDDDLFSF